MDNVGNSANYLRGRAAYVFDHSNADRPRWTITDARMVVDVLRRLDRLERRSRITSMQAANGEAAQADREQASC